MPVSPCESGTDPRQQAERAAEGVEGFLHGSSHVFRRNSSASLKTPLGWELRFDEEEKVFFLPSGLFCPSREGRWCGPERRLPHACGEGTRRGKSLGPLTRGRQVHAPTWRSGADGLAAPSSTPAWVHAESPITKATTCPPTPAGLDFELLRQRQREKCESKSCGPRSGPVHGHGRVPYIHGAWAEPKTGGRTPPCPGTCSQTRPRRWQSERRPGRVPSPHPAAGLRWLERRGGGTNGCSPGPAQNAEGLWAMAKIAMICPKSTAPLIVQASPARL